MRLRLAVAAAVAAFACVLPALAQAPETHSFTLNNEPILTVIQYHSYYTWYGNQFDGVQQNLWFTEVEHLDTGLFDFTFPVATLTGCVSGLPQSSIVYTSVSRRSEITVRNFSCVGWAGQTTTTTLQYRSWTRFKYMWFDFQSGQPPIIGTLTVQQ